MKTANDSWKQVVSVEAETRQETVYNFEVEDNHNYFVGDIGFLVHNDGCGFANKLAGRLTGELATAARLGIKPLKVGEAGFDNAVNSGTVKWAITQNGQLLVIPKYAADGTEIAHTVLTNGDNVLAAGEAEIAGAGGQYVLLEINNHSGHYLPGQEVIEIGRRAFASLGIR